MWQPLDSFETLSYDVRMNKFTLVFLIGLLGACSSANEKLIEVSSEAQSERIEAKVGEPQRVEVQHILIAFKGSLPGKEVERSFEEAEAFAKKLEAKARESKKFEELVRAHSDDQFPGIYKLANIGVSLRLDEYRRADMTRAFGDASFAIKKGEVVFVNFHKTTSPYGFHIIKRLN